MAITVCQRSAISLPHVFYQSLPVNDCVSKAVNDRLSNPVSQRMSVKDCISKVDYQKLFVKCV